MRLFTFVFFTLVYMFQAHAQQLPGVEYAPVAPGCTITMPTERSMLAYCRKQSEETCNKGCNYESGICSHNADSYFKGPSNQGDLGMAVVGVDELLEKAHAAAGAKKYPDAVGHYNEALKLDSGDTRILVSRGLVREYMGGDENKKRALSDYCLGVAKARNWKTEQIAYERIKQLTDAQAPRKPIPRIANSAVIRIVGKEMASLTITTAPGDDYLLRLKDERNRERVLIFVRAHSDKWVAKVPLGTYTLVGARGPIWYGSPNYFGDDTYYFRFKQKDQEHDEKFVFEVKDGKVWGNILTLRSVAGGTLQTQRISKEQFEAE